MAPIFDFVSIPAFVIAFVIHMALGALWYSPLVFGDAFMRIAHGSKKPEPDPVAMRAAALGTAISMPFFAFLLSVVGCRTAGEGSCWGLAFAVFLDCGLNAPFPFFEERPLALFLMGRGYHMVSLFVVGAVLGALCGVRV